MLEALALREKEDMVWSEEFEVLDLEVGEA